MPKRFKVVCIPFNSRHYTSARLFAFFTFGQMARKDGEADENQMLFERTPEFCKRPSPWATVLHLAHENHR